MRQVDGPHPTDRSKAESKSKSKSKSKSESTSTSKSESASEQPGTPGPVGAVLADAFPDTDLIGLALYTAPDGTLLATPADRAAGAVRLSAGDEGLTAEPVATMPDEADLEPVEDLEPPVSAYSE